MTERTAEERERMIDILSTDSLWETSRGFEVVADTLLAAGFGDVSAERERADRAETDTRRKIAQEVHDWAALHAGPEGSYAARIIENRIREKLSKDGLESMFGEYTGPGQAIALTEDQPPATPEPTVGIIYTPEHPTTPERPSVDASKYPPGTRWMSGDNSVWEVEWDDQDKRYAWVMVQPAATPEPNDGPGSDGNHTETGECFACLVGVATGPESHGNGCIFATPEPPRLDPKPWRSGRGVRYATGDIYFGETPLEFAPREHDENGKPYSRKREDYEV